MTLQNQIYIFSISIHNHLHNKKKSYGNTAKMISHKRPLIPHTNLTSPCSSPQRSVFSVKDLALGIWGGGPSISEPRVLQKKEELYVESLTTGLCSLCSDPATSVSQATINYHLEVCYRLYDGGDGRQPLGIQAEQCDAIEGLRNTFLNIRPAL